MSVQALWKNATLDASAAPTSKAKQYSRSSDLRPLQDGCEWQPSSNAGVPSFGRALRDVLGAGRWRSATWRGGHRRTWWAAKANSTMLSLADRSCGSRVGRR